MYIKKKNKLNFINNKKKFFLRDMILNQNNYYVNEKIRATKFIAI